MHETAVKFYIILKVYKVKQCTPEGALKQETSSILLMVLQLRKIA